MTENNNDALDWFSRFFAVINVILWGIYFAAGCLEFIEDGELSVGVVWLLFVEFGRLKRRRVQFVLAAGPFQRLPIVLGLFAPPLQRCRSVCFCFIVDRVVGDFLTCFGCSGDNRWWDSWWYYGEHCFELLPLPWQSIVIACQMWRC